MQILDRMGVGYISREGLVEKLRDRLRSASEKHLQRAESQKKTKKKRKVEDTDEGN